MKQSASPSWQSKFRKQPPKNKAPRLTREKLWRGAFRNVLHKKGCGSPTTVTVNYAWKVPKLKIKCLPIFLQYYIRIQLQCEKISPQCKTPASLRADWQGFMFLNYKPTIWVQAPSLEDLSPCVDDGGVNDHFQLHSLIINPRRRNKKPRQPSCRLTRFKLGKSASTTPWGLAVLCWRWRCQWLC